MEEEKPKKQPSKTKLRYPGMKKLPKFGNKKGVKLKKYEPLTYKGKLKYGLSEGQKRTNAEFMKVREGETIEQWKKRTRRRRVMEVDEIKELALTNPLRIHFRNRERNKAEIRNKHIMVQPVEREFDFMRYYGIVINYCSIKFGVRVEDFQLGFYFYTNIPFTKDRFDNAAVLHLGTCAGKLHHFIKNGYLEEVMHKIKHYEAPNTYERTHLYRLTQGFVNKLTYIYRILGKMNTIQLNQPLFSSLSPEIKQMIQDMNDQIMDIQTGRKPQEKLITK